MSRPSTVKSRFWRSLVLTQLASAVLLLTSLAWAYSPVAPLRQASSPVLTAPEVPVPPRTEPLFIAPLYDDPEVVSDEELALVLKKVQPRFPQKALKPNYVEHALRAWTIHAKFKDPDVMSGEQMKEFLTNHGQFLASWGEKIEPILEDRQTGVAIRWGKEQCASVHHDHWLASLTEAGVSLHEPVFLPGGKQRNIGDVLRQSMLDFRVDEIEVEWSAMAFGLWLAPQREWVNNQGRQINFDLLAERLVRGHQRFGVCTGTHRVYSLMLLIRLDDEYHILSPAGREVAWKHLEFIRDQITVSQFEDGHWPSNWSDGALALKEPVEDELYKKVIATGHHLEWLAIAPKELHPPREQILKAADWVISTTTSQTPEQILGTYTFFSHVGNALALWRNTRPNIFFEAWEARESAGGK